MALFPAYGSTDEIENETDKVLVWKDNDDIPSEAVEFHLLASDTEESEPEKESQTNKEPSRIPTSQSNITNEFYFDSKSDYGNLRVSTLYYPGRPEYRCKKGDYAVGAKYVCKEKRVRRYFTHCPSEDPDAPAVTERAEAYQLLLAENPDDLTLWEKFIDFQERCGSAEAALAVAERAAERHPHALRGRLLDCVRAALPPHAQLRRLRELLAAEPTPRARLALWERLLPVLAAQPDADADALAVAAAAAVTDTRAAPRSYPRLLYAAGVQLRAAGLWERLVLLVELAVGMNLSVDAIPPPPPAERVERAERRLADLEDKVTASGLPLSTVWARVERARAAAHWRAAPDEPPPADPQRQPRAHLVADLLQPLVAPDDLLHLSVRLLMLAKVPVVPGTDWAARAFDGAQADCAEALLPLVCAAHELPAAHPARAPPAVARRLLALALDPPHYFSDESGYLGWTEALWDACCAAAHGAARVALLGWRVRWLRAQLLLTEENAAGRAERERVRAAARGALRTLRCAEPVVVAELARLELLAAGPARAAATAALALRSALSAGPVEHALYVARVVGEVSPAEGPAALVSAVLGRAAAAEPLTPEDCAAALQRCEERCEELEREFTADTDEQACAALLPGAGEWARARAALAPPLRRCRLLTSLAAAAGAAGGAVGGAARRYYEEGGEALVRAAASEGGAAAAARELAPLFPHNAYLALASAGAPLWAWRTQSQDERMRSLVTRARSDVGELAEALPPLLRALSGDEPFGSAAASEAAARALRRATGGARGARAGALLWSLRLEAEARAPRPRLPHALYAALDAAPAHKWLYVRGAAWCGGAAEALEDALLERQLRLHALRDELRPHADAPQPALELPSDASAQCTL